MSYTSAHDLPVIEKVEGILQRIRQGKMVIMVDDHLRENEGDLVMAAEDASAEDINFMAKEARGLICLPMEDSFIQRLKLPMMSDHSKTEDSRHTAFTVSIEARRGVSTGISAQDRATTIQRAIDDDATPDDIVVPGHVFPLKARAGGVLTRAGHTEGSVDLAKLAGKKGASVICEIMNDDGTMARSEDLRKFSELHDIPIISIEELITYRLLYDSLIQEIRREQVSTPYGSFEAVWFESTLDYSQHVALMKGHPTPQRVSEVRVYRARFFEDVFGAAESSSRLRRVEYGLQMLASCEVGVYLYLSARRGLNRMPSHLNPPMGSVQSVMDPRLYGIGAQILRKLGVGRLILNTLAPRSFVALGGFGLEVVGMKVLGDMKEVNHSSAKQEERGKENHQKKRSMLQVSHNSLAAAPPFERQKVADQQERKQKQSSRSQASITDSDQRPASQRRFLILSSQWHPEVVESLVSSSRKILMDAGVAASSIGQWQVPGAYELIAACTRAAHDKKWDAILCLGCIVKGQTSHDQLIAAALNRALVDLQLSTFTAIIHGVLVVDRLELALERSREGGVKNRGIEAAEAALKLVESLIQGPTTTGDSP